MRHRVVCFVVMKCFRLIFMVATLLCLLLNKPDLFSVTQHRFILINLDTLMCMLHVSVCTETILRNPLYDFCIGIAVNGLRTGRNMLHTCKRKQLN